MRIVIIGGYGLIGSAVTARLIADGHAVTGAGRDIAGAARRQPAARWMRADLARFTVADWTPLLAGADAVVNCAGALQDGAGDDLAAVHVTGVATLAEAARAAGVRRLVHVSAAGADPASPVPFLRTKGQAERALAEAGLDTVALRPGFVFAPQAFGGSALLRALASVPLAIPALHPQSPVETVAADDVAEAVVRALALPPQPFLAIDLAAPGTRLADILTGLRGWLGLPPAPIVALPRPLAALGAAAADAAALFGWKSPMRSAALAQLARGVTARPDAGPEPLGMSVRPLGEVLACHPAGVQDLWFARLYLAKPLILLTLGLFWLVSGVIGLMQIDNAARVLTSIGMAEPLARGFVIGGGFADIVLGAAVLVRRTAALALGGMIAVTGGYLAGATFWRPDLWADPLGVLVKTIPAAVLALVALALLPSR
jgi:uncharacterized protein YbjT (DUF2867 family)